MDVFLLDRITGFSGLLLKQIFIGIDIANYFIMEYEKITEKIIGCAFTVFNQMGSGYLESVYERCMLIELKRAGLYAKSQHPIKVLYENQIVGELFSFDR